ERYHRFYSPLDFIKGILDNIYSGRPAITRVEDSTLLIEYKPLNSSKIKTDWKELDESPDYVRGSIVSVRKELLASPTARIKTKEDLDRWFLMIKRALPVKRMVNGCFQRCAFAESLLSVMGLKTKIVTIYPEKEAYRVKFNPESRYQLDVNWSKHRICAVELPEDHGLYILDFSYEEAIPWSMHPNIYSGNQCNVCDPAEDQEPKSEKSEWRTQQRSDSEYYAPDKPKNGHYFTHMTWDKQNRKWQRSE
ncbi:hypothetical protein CAPTEDRAFT_208945, partial [Capitella teleta]